MMGEPGSLRGSSRFFPSLPLLIPLPHYTQAQRQRSLQLGEASSAGGQVHHPEPHQRPPDDSKPLGPKSGAIGAGSGFVALTSMAGKYWLGW